jgi:signal transduction histidine kinase
VRGACDVARRPARRASGAGPAIVVDKHKITQALGNLLDNAVDASQPGGRVEVRWTLDGAHGGHVGMSSATPGSEFVLSLPLELKAA